jgi:RimJ/RimL family protein N-acetyltransferase
MNIRAATHSDITQIVDFQILMAAETEDYKLDRETVTAGVRHIFDHPEKGNYWVAVKNDEIIACTLTIPEWSDWRNGTVLWIHSVFVKQGNRGKGVFKSIYKFLKEKVERDPSLMGLRLYVEKENINAQHVYERLGMTSEHYRLYEWMKDF